MRIGIVGASGNVGSRVLTEARARSHEVIAFTRHAAGNRPAHAGVEWRDWTSSTSWGVMWIRSPDQLGVLGKKFREVLRAIRDYILNCEQIHLFYAGPTGGAVTIGHRIAFDRCLTQD